MGQATKPCVKGSHLVQAQMWVDAQMGAGTFKRLTATGGSRWNVPLHGSWYEADILVEALNEVCAKLKKPIEEVSREIARRNAEDLTSIYKFFLKLAQPQRLLTFTPRLWSTYCNFGRAEAVVNERGHFIGEGHDLPQHLLDWAAGAWCGFIPAAIQMAGGREPSGAIVSKAPAANGMGSLRFESHYR
jgi:hypothetical protein